MFRRASMEYRWYRSRFLEATRSVEFFIDSSPFSPPSLPPPRLFRRIYDSSLHIRHDAVDLYSRGDWR